MTTLEKKQTIKNINTKEKFLDVINRQRVWLEEGSGITSGVTEKNCKERMESVLFFYSCDEDFAYNWLDGEERENYIADCKHSVETLLNGGWEVFLKDSMFEYRPYLSSDLIFVLQKGFFEEFGNPIRSKYMTPEAENGLEYYGDSMRNIQ